MQLLVKLYNHSLIKILKPSCFYERAFFVMSEPELNELIELSE